MKKNKNLIIGVSLTVLIVIVAVIVFLIKSKELNTKDSLVEELYTYLGSNDLSICDGLRNYSDKEVNYDTISNDMRICLAYSLLDREDATVMKIDKSKKNNTCSIGNDVVFATDNYEDKVCTITKIDANTLNEKYKAVYGKEIDNYEKFQYDNSTICYYDSGFYYCGLSENYTYSVGAEPHTYRSINKAVKDNDEIVIYDYFLETVNDECFGTYNSNNKDEKCSEKLAKTKDVDFKFVKKYGSKYKHTFKKDNDSYYWVKSELVK